jgi:hypothetical protein
MALSISPTCRARRGRCSIRSANLGPGLARPPAPTAGAFFFREFVTSADSFLLPQLRRRSHCCQAMVATNKCLAKSNKSDAGGKATTRRESRSPRHCASAPEMRPTEGESIPRDGTFD